MTHPGAGTRQLSVDRVLSPDRLIRFGWAVVFALASAFVLFVVTADGVEALAGGRLGGDWAPFWAAGRLAMRNPSSLLDPLAQYELMAPFLRGEFAPFAYPPVVAFLFAPMSLLPFTVGYVIWVTVLVGAGLLGIRCLLDLFGVVSPVWRRIAYLWGIAFPGMFRSYAGAQNATITLLLLAAGHLLLARGRVTSAGLVVGLLWFKPQFAIPTIGLLFVAGHVRAAVTAGLVGAGMWGMNAVVFGVDWVSEWWTGVLSVTDAGNQLFNTQATVSAVEYLRGRLAPDGDLWAAAVLAFFAALAIALARRRATPRDLVVVVTFGLLTTALHALPYELALLLPMFGRGLVDRGRAALGMAAALHLLGLLMLTGVHPLVRVVYVLAVGGCGLAATGARRPDARRPTSP